MDFRGERILRPLAIRRVTQSQQWEARSRMSFAFKRTRCSGVCIMQSLLVLIEARGISGINCLGSSEGSHKGWLLPGGGGGPSFPAEKQQVLLTLTCIQNLLRIARTGMVLRQPNPRSGLHLRLSSAGPTQSSGLSTHPKIALPFFHANPQHSSDPPCARSTC